MTTRWSHATLYPGMIVYCTRITLGEEFCLVHDPEIVAPLQQRLQRQDDFEAILEMLGTRSANNDFDFDSDTEPLACND